MSRSVASAVGALAGLTSTATRTALGHQIAQQPQPLSRDLSDEEIDTGGVAARASKAGDKTQLDRVFTHAKDDWNCRGRGFGRKRSRIAAGYRDNGHATANKVGHERR